MPERRGSRDFQEWPRQGQARRPSSQPPAYLQYSHWEPEGLREEGEKLRSKRPLHFPITPNLPLSSEALVGDREGTSWMWSQETSPPVSPDWVPSPFSFPRTGEQGQGAGGGPQSPYSQSSAEPGPGPQGGHPMSPTFTPSGDTQGQGSSVSYFLAAALPPQTPRSHLLGRVQPHLLPGHWGSQSLWGGR